ncbi:MAG: hypothetical protein AB7G88_02415, partial [Thermomicrobiales bacterium]
MATFELTSAGIADVAAFIIATCVSAAKTVVIARQISQAVRVVSTSLASCAQPLAGNSPIAAIGDASTGALRTPRAAALARREIALVTGGAVILLIATPTVTAGFDAPTRTATPETVAAAVVDIAAFSGVAFVTAALQSLAAAKGDAIVGIVTGFRDVAEPRAFDLTAAAILHEPAFIVRTLQPC